MFDREAVITEIQRFSVHDGPGIRTVVFFKGCPLSCKWCQNPETNRLVPEVLYMRELCIGCQECVRICRSGHLVNTEVKCMACGECARVCPSTARKQVGEKYTINSLLELLLRDEVFYHNSKGGVTLSGGEAALQYEFVYDLLCRLSERGIHTAMETCGYVEEKIFRSLAERIDLLLFDIKHTDSEKHRQFTGKDNILIIKNFLWAVKMEKQIIVRFPLIPNVNDDEETLSNVTAFCLSAGLRDIHVLPFHQAGQSKWLGLEKEYFFKGMESLDGEAVEKVKRFFETKGISVNVGGYC